MDIRSQGLPPGIEGTRRTLNAMAAFVRRDSQYNFWRGWRVKMALLILARQLVRSLPSQDSTGEIATLFEFVRDRIRWVPDPVDVELVQDATRTLLFRQGDCDDLVVLLATLLALIGVRSRFVAVGLITPRGLLFVHVYLEAYDPRTRSWIALDPTNKQAQAGWAPPAHVRMRCDAN